MELETLEVLLDINTARVEQSLERVLPQIESAMSRIQQMSGNSMDRTEKNMDIEKGTNNFSKQLDKMTQLLEKSLNNFERSTKQTSETVGDNFSSGIRKARPKVTKEIDAMVNEINAKMGQAKAAQEKVAYLKSQRQTASSQGDTGKVVKYDEQIARAQAQMTKFKDQAAGLGNTIKRELDAVPSSLGNITKGMSQNEAQIEAMRKRIRTLKAEYNDQRVPTGSFTSGFKNYEDTPESLKTSGEIQKQSIKMNKLISDNDRLQKEYSQTEDRAEALRKALQRVNSALGQSSIQTGNASKGASMTGTGLKQSERAVSKYGGVFNRMSNAVSHGFGSVGNGLSNSLGFIGKFGSLFSSNSNKVTAGTNRMTGSTNAFGQSMKYLLPSLVVYQLLGGAITKLASGMMSALKTNDQFSASLNQIKVNLMTAFYPIYTAILPALNMLMSTVAQLTGQLASFVTMLFGKTYDAAKQGASGLYDNIQALNDTGSSANKANEKVKKLQKSLMGFDQINKLTMDTDDEKKEDSAPGIDFGSATGTYSTPKWMKDIQNILKNFFKPFQDAWKNQGQRVINAWKYALGEVIGLASAIGKSFMEVWTNGTGQLFIENILILLADILGIIGDIAGAFKRAWEDNGRGTRLIQSIFDMWNRILELLNEVAVAFRNAWNDGRGESIAANILEIYTNIFNTIGNIAEQLKKAWKEGEVGESIFGTILDAVDDLLGNINGMTKATEKWAKNLDFTPLLKAIDGLFKSIRPILKNVGDGLEWLYKNVLLPLASFFIEDYVPKYFDMFSAALKVLNQVIEIFKPIFKWFWDVVIVPLSQVAKFLILTQLEALTKGLEFLAEVLGKVANAVKNPKKAIGELKDVIDDRFGKIMKTVSDTWGNIQKWTGDTWTNAKKTVTDKASDIWKNVSGRWSDIKKNTKETWDTFSTDVSNKARTAKDNVSNRLQELRTNVSDRWNNVKKNTVEKWNEIQDKVTTAAGNAKSKASTAFTNLKDSMGGSFETMKKNASEAFDKITGWATGLGEKIGKGLGDGVKSVKEGAGKIFDGIVGVIGGGVNGVIKGIKWVLNKVGASSAAEAMKTWTVPKYPNYVKGTNYHPGGMALVNDGLGSNYQEAYRTPDGRTGIFPAQRNLMVNLPKGTSVLSGPKTAAMYGVPAYANGVGEWLKEKWDGAKEIASDIWSYASNPKKLLNAAVSKFVNLSNAFEPALSMAKGAVGTVAEGSYEWFKSKFDAGHEAQNSSFDGSMGSWGVYKYLYDIAKKTVDRYPGMRITSGFRPGDPHSHGKHQAIDVAYPASMNGSSKYMAPANWVFDNFASKVAYVITQGKVRDRKGMSGTGSSGSWVRWPQNDHYDHLHINGSLGTSDIDKNALFGAIGGAAVGNGGWTSKIKQAASKLGQRISSSEINGVLAQIQRESGGNQSITQSSAVWDINMANGNPARGLLQYIPSTFNAYKLRGYENIFNGYHQLLAFFNNSNWRYDLPYGHRGWGPTGRRIVGYENGGIVNQDGLYRMGEGNKKEMVIPLEKPQRAAELIQQAVKYLGLDMFNSSIVLPEMFQEPTFTPSNSTFSNNNQMNYEGGGMKDFTSSMVTTLMNAISALGATPTQAPNGDIVINIGGKEFGRIAVKEINKYHQQLGYTELNI
ncbi:MULTISPECIES: phage tail protein [unclassified Enterococcus]|uniref:phage tail protein n=1 Tax=unclassified Enterococcus TaxID=2608891 RepID=UPI0019048761|nr:MULTISPECIES: phage tail protein [unclassified Enterococcus]MBK0036673.1 phage tail protein [Enterococcus sp. S52]MBK0069336.1 phage tail protein [Enterococcus sp. S53]MBK0139929.1 phage tail protein [Enterococcus sp. S76]MBK0143612.1 phage tail protein [Enterococcus sp. S77]